jgi:hypothetical protein
LCTFVEKSTVACRRRALQALPDWSVINGSIGGLLARRRAPPLPESALDYRDFPQCIGHIDENPPCVSTLCRRDDAAIRQRIFTPLTISGSIFALGGPSDAICLISTW